MRRRRRRRDIPCVLRVEGRKEGRKERNLWTYEDQNTLGDQERCAESVKELKPTKAYGGERIG